MSILRKRVLVLNKDWSAIGTCTVRRAITLMSNFDEDQPKAKSIGDDLNIYDFEQWCKLDPGNNYIKTPSINIKCPSVIISRTKSLPRVSPGFTRSAIFERDNYCCQYCSEELTNSQLTVDHIVPRCRNGKNSWTNCVTCCKHCNNWKGDRTPEEADMQLIKQPTRPGPVLFYGPVPEFWKKFLTNL